jgi:hypothetical protein
LYAAQNRIASPAGKKHPHISISTSCIKVFSTIG